MQKELIKRDFVLVFHLPFESHISFFFKLENWTVTAIA